MKSKFTKIQILKKGMAIILSAMFLVTPITYATTSLDDSYLESSVLDQILYGKIGSTVKEIEEWLVEEHTTLYITNETQLRAFAEYVNNGNDCSGKEIILFNDIELDSEKDWTPIKGFKGIFNGNNKKINNVRYSGHDKILDELNAVGFFGALHGAVKNLTLENVAIDVTNINAPEEDYSDISYTGGIAGYNYGIIENCTVTGSIKGVQHVGGIAGGTGDQGNEIRRCTNKAEVESTGDYVGGIAGSSHEGDIKYCLNIGKVNGYEYVGGILGRDETRTQLSSSINKGDVEGYNYIGGILGTLGQDEMILDLKNDGNVTGDNYVGGIIGINFGDLQNVTNNGKITGSNYVGGIAGKNDSTIGYCINNGQVDGDTNTGNIAGISHVIDEEGIDGALIKDTDVGANSGVNKTIQTIDDETGLNATYELPEEGYYNAGDTIKVIAKFNKYLAKTYGPLVPITEAPVLKINNQIEMNGDIKSDNKNYTTTIEYTYVIKEGDNLNIETINLSNLQGIYAVGSNYQSVHPTITTETKEVKVNNIIVDTTKPTVNTKVYVDNMLETERYTAGKEIKFEVTTSEKIKGTYTTPEIKVSFSESGIGKYNYSKNKGAGFAKCTDAKINLDGTTTWTYSYQIQEFDEGQVEFKFTAGKIEDLAGNSTDIAALYTPEIKEPSKPVTGTEWGNDLGVTYKFYQNDLEHEVTSQTYFTNEDDLIVVATFDKVLYVHYGLSDGKNTNIRLNDDYIDKAPNLYLNKDSKLKQSGIDEVTTTEYDEENATAGTTTVQYRFTDIAKNYGLTQLTQVHSLILKNENNEEEVGYNDTTVSTNGLIPYAEKWYETYKDEDEDLYNKTLTSGKTKTTTGFDEILIDPVGVSEKIDKSNIYADTTAPKVEIIADKSNPTNSDNIIYTFRFSEEVKGFTKEDISVSNGSIVGDLELINKDKVYESVLKYGDVNKDSVIDMSDAELIMKYINDWMDVPTNEIEKCDFNNDNKVNNRDYIILVGYINYGKVDDLYQIEISPSITEGNEGEVKVTIEEGACTDLVAINNVRQENIITIDKVAPTVQIQADKDYVKADETITYTFTWSEKVNGFTAEDIFSISGGEIVSNTLTKINDLQYTIEGIARNGNDFEIKVLSGAVNDVAGNENMVEAEHLITVIPTVAITTNVESNPTNVSGIEYTFTWSEEVVGFDEKDIILPEGITGTFNPETNTMTVDYNSLIPNGNEGEVTLAVKESAVQDVNGNYNTYTSNTLKIDRIAPIFVGLEAHVDSTLSLDSDVDTVKEYYKAGDKVVITATFTESITNSTAPALALKFSESGNAKGSIEEPKLEGNQIIYTYAIADGDMGTLSVRGFSGEVKDAAGNITTVGKKSLDGNTIIADTDAPSLNELKIVSPYTGTYKEGQPIEIHAIYDENVYALENNEIKNITSGTAPTLKVKFEDGEEREASFNGYVGEDKTKLKYTISILDGENGLLSITSCEYKENAKVCDIAGNESSLGVNQTGNEITADTERPEVESITAVVENPTISGTDIYYKEGNRIKITLTFNEEVSSAAVLWPEILIGFSEEAGIEPTEYNTYAYESDWNINSTTIEYSYIIREGDNGYLWVKVPEGQFKDIAGNTNLPKEGEEKLNVFADTIIPTVTLYRDTEAVQNNQTIVIKAEFNENVYDLKGTNRVTLTKENAPKLIYSFGTGENREVSASNIDGAVITYTITKDPVNDNGTLLYELAKGNLCDRAGNLFYTETTDTTAPVLESVRITSNAGTYAPYCKIGKEIYVIATFDEPIKAENMKLKAKVGEVELSELLDGEIVEENATMVKFTYTVKAGDMGEFKILDICGETDSKITEENADNTYGWVQDAYGNQNNIYNLADEGVTVTGEAEADTEDPYITSIKVIGNDKEIATYTKEKDKDAVINVGRTNANIVEYIVTYNEKVPYSHFEKISITNGTIKDIEYTNLALNEYKITVQTTIEGVYSLIINEGTIEDKAGNIDGFVRFDAVTIDFTKPTVRFISEYNGGTYILPTNINKVEIRPNVEINEDIEKIEYKWNDGDYVRIENYSASSDIAVPTKAFTEVGTYVLHIRVVDLAGNVTETSKTYKVLNSAIGIELNTYEYTNQNITATVSFGAELTDNRKVTFKAEGSNELITLNASGVAENGGINYVISTNGTIYAEATDRIGNKVFTEYTIRNIDKEAPVIDIKLNGANLVIGTEKDKATIKTDVETSDNNFVEEAKYVFLQEDIDISGYKNMTEEQKAAIRAKIVNTLQDEVRIEAISTKDKPYYLYVIAADAAGNETVVKSGAFTVVNTNEIKTTITVEGENGPEEKEEITPAEKPVNTLIIFKQEKEEIRDKAYVSVDYDDSIIKESEITLADKDYGIAINDNMIELYGNTTIQVKAWDACGNEVRHEYKVIDIEGPEFSINGNPENWTNGDVELEIYSNTELKALTLSGKNILEDNKYRVNTVITEYGNYTFKATDIYNNTSEQTIEVKIDKSAPEITDVKIEDGKIVITANDIDKTLNKELSGLAEYAITDTTEVPVEWSKSNVINVTKDQNFFVWAKDNAGNITTKEEIVVRDITAPKLTITTDVSLDKWTNTDIKVEVKSNEELSSLVVKYKEEVMEEDGTTTEVEKEESILDNLTYTIKSNKAYEIVATDKAGNEAKKTLNVTRIDKDLPVISEVIVAGESITITATDEISGVKEYAISKVTEEPTEWSKSNVVKTTEDGIYYVWVKDKAGNISIATETDEAGNKTQKEIIIDTKAPIVTFNYLSQTITVGMPIEVNITTDEDAIISYSWDKENWVDSTELLTSLKISEKSTTVGKYTLYIKAQDNAGNISKVQALEFDVVTMEEIKQPDVVFEDIPTIQVNGVRYVKVSSDVTTQYLTNRMNVEALCGKTPEYTKLTEDGKLRTGSEIAINGSTKYVIVVKGDVNGDGGIDFIKDIIRANNYRLGIIDLSIPQILAADVNNNGKIEFIQDIIAINNYRLGLIKSL